MSAPVEQKAWLTRRLRAQAPASFGVSLSLNWRSITGTRCPALPAALPPQTWCRGRRAAAGTPQSRYRRMQLKGGLLWRAESSVSRCRGRSKRLWKARSTMSTCPSPLVTSSPFLFWMVCVTPTLFWPLGTPTLRPAPYSSPCCLLAIILGDSPSIATGQGGRTTLARMLMRGALSVCLPGNACNCHYWPAAAKNAPNSPSLPIHPPSFAPRGVGWRKWIPESRRPRC